MHRCSCAHPAGCWRIYRDTPAASLPLPSADGEPPGLGDAAGEQQQQQPQPQPPQQHHHQQDGGAEGNAWQEEAEGEDDDADSRALQRLQRLREYLAPADDPQQREGKWELVASKLEEFQVGGG